MATTKVTFALDQASVERLIDLAEQLGKSKSEVAREAIRQYCERHVDGVHRDEGPPPKAPISSV
jgi:predicted transcriptional regulator